MWLFDVAQHESYAVELIEVLCGLGGSCEDVMYKRF